MALKDPAEIKLMESSQSPGLRVADRSTYGVRNIFRHFFYGVVLDGKVVLELGPGHYEFCEEVRARRGLAEAIDIDPTVLELGRRRGFDVRSVNLAHLPTLSWEKQYDGLFSKGSTNPFWFYNDREALHGFVRSISSLVKPTGFLWIVSCPHAGSSSVKLNDSQVKQWLDTEAACFEEYGFQSYSIDHQLIGSLYDITYVPPATRIFTRNLPRWRWGPTLPLVAAECLAVKISRRLHATARTISRSVYR